MNTSWYFIGGYTLDYEVFPTGESSSDQVRTPVLFQFNQIGCRTTHMPSGPDCFYQRHSASRARNQTYVSQLFTRGLVVYYLSLRGHC